MGGGRTREDDEVGVLGADDAVEEGGDVEVGAAGDLLGQHVLARGAPPVRVVHVRHLQHLERAALPPERSPPPPTLRKRRMTPAVGPFSSAASRRSPPP